MPRLIYERWHLHRPEAYMSPVSVTQGRYEAYMSPVSVTQGRYNTAERMASVTVAL